MRLQRSPVRASANDQVASASSCAVSRVCVAPGRMRGSRLQSVVTVTKGKEALSMAFEDRLTCAEKLSAFTPCMCSRERFWHACKLRWKLCKGPSQRVCEPGALPWVRRAYLSPGQMWPRRSQLGRYADAGAEYQLDSTASRWRVRSAPPLARAGGVERSVACGVTTRIPPRVVGFERLPAGPDV